MSEWIIYENGAKSREWDFKNPDGKFSPEEFDEFFECFFKLEKFGSFENREKAIKGIFQLSVRDRVEFEKELIKLSEDLKGLVIDNLSGKNIEQKLDLTYKWVGRIIAMIKYTIS